MSMITPRLYREALMWPVLYLVTATLGAVIFGPQWACGFLPVMFFVSWLLFRNIDQNCATLASARNTSLGWGTFATLLRGLLIAGVSGFLFLESPLDTKRIVPGIMYLIAVILDRVDGWLARRTDHVTLLGAKLDINMDAMGLLVAPLLAVHEERLPAIYLLLSFAYFIFRAALWLWQFFIRPIHLDRLRPSQHSRVFAGFQMVLVAFSLLPWLSTTTLKTTAYIFMVPVLVGFMRDFLLAIGVISPEQPAYQVWLRRLLLFTRSYAPFSLRIGLAVWLASSSSFTTMPNVLICGFTFIILGFFARTSVLVTLILLPATTDISLIAVLAALLILGPGRHALYTPEERWLFPTQTPAPFSVKTAFSIVFGFFGLLVGVYAFHQISWPHAKKLLAEMKASTLCLIITLNIIAMALWALRAQLVGRGLQIHLAYGRWLLLRLATLPLNYFVPGPPIAGETFSVWCLAKHTGPSSAKASLATALHWVIWDRLVEFMTHVPMLIMGSIVVLLQLGHILHIEPQLHMGMMGLLFALGVLLFVFRKRFWTQLRLPDIFTQPPRLKAALLVSAGNWLITFFEFVLVWQILGSKLTVTESLLGFLFARLAFLLPVPAGIGVLEGGQMFFAQQFGQSSEAALLVCVWIRARDLFFVAVGALSSSFLSWSTKRPTPIAPHPTTSDAPLPPHAPPGPTATPVLDSESVP